LLLVLVHRSASSLLIQGVIFINVWNGLNRLEIHMNWFFSSSFKHYRTKKVDAFTSGLLDIHSKMLEINKKEVSVSQLGIWIYHVSFGSFKIMSRETSWFSLGDNIFGHQCRRYAWVYIDQIICLMNKLNYSSK
jgi:hypothetical protein